MNMKHTVRRNSPTLNAQGMAFRLTTPVVFVGGLLVSLIAMADSAWAHVKWFVACNVSDDPLPVGAVLTMKFFLF